MKRWGANELAVVIADFPRGGSKACAPQLAGRSVDAIQKKAERLGVCAAFHTKQRLMPPPSMNARLPRAGSREVPRGT